MPCFEMKGSLEPVQLTCNEEDPTEGAALPAATPAVGSQLTLHLEFVRHQERLTSRAAARLQAWFLRLSESVASELAEGRRCVDIVPARSAPRELGFPRMRELERALRRLFGDRLYVVRELERPGPPDTVTISIGPYGRR